MIKKFLVFISSLIIMVSPIFILNSFADVVTINSPLQEPEVSLTTDSSGIHLKAYSVYYDPRGYVDYEYRMYVYEATFPLNSEPVFYVGMNSWLEVRINCNQNFTYSLYTYDCLTGTLKAINSNISSSLMNSSSYGYVDPDHLYSSTLSGSLTSANNNLVKGFYSVPSNLLKVYYQNNQNLLPYTWQVDPFVNWSFTPINTSHYSSFISEPVCDELNRYFVLAGEDHEYIYVLRYFMSESYIYQVENSISPNNTVQAFLNNLVCPYVDLNNNGLQLSLNVDSDLFALLNATTQSTYLFYDLQVAKYNLLDGQFLQSWVYTDIEMSDDPVVLDVDLGDPEDYDSCQFWGVMFQDTSTRYHYNLLACSWAQDPDFISWRQSIENYLDLIYSILSESEESATIEQDTSGMDEMMSARDALEVTDSHGEHVDPAEQVEVAFSQAAEGLSQVAPGVVSVNNLITQLFSTHPLVTVPIIVALALGLIVTILGKDKSD